ncbi:hypothetical protein [Chryseobacterium gossypii]|uniref:hypothetical protein n=1 Tax=Chryseobacterium gossypii TaxID=3231602 RepID=UPI003523530C
MKQEKNTAVTPIIKIENPNDKFIIYEGNFELKNSKSETINVNGKIYFKWFPHIGSKFTGEIINGKNSVSFFEEDKLQFIVNNNVVANCYISNQEIGSNYIISGGFYGNIVLGDKSLTSQKFKFSLLNLEDFLGDNIESNTEKSTRYSSGRIFLKNKKFEIFIDKDFDYKTKSNLLKEEGGFHILYNGEINFYKDSLNFNQINEIIEILGTFLSFVSGKKNTPLFLSAIHEDVILYQDFTGYHNYPYEYRPSWSNLYTTGYLNDLFQNFYDVWKSTPENKFFLSSIIHWYTEINCNSGYSEGSLILAQTALELLYNWLVIENKKLIIGKDSENISAANKIRLLISQSSIPYDIPAKFTKLEKYRKDSKLPDGIEAIVQIRNAIVHSQEEKRKKLSEIDNMAIYEAVQLSLWYIELTILNILKFDDKYTNRCSVELVSSYKLELPPWSK